MSSPELPPIATGAASLPFMRLQDEPGVGRPDDLSDEALAREIGYDPDLWLYRGRTLSLLKRYLRLSVEAGRLPSLLGRELFRGRVTSYSTATFEDAIIFVHDVERSLEQLDDFDRQVIAALVFQEHNSSEAACLLRCGRRTVVRRFGEALDRTADLFLCGGLLRRLPKLEREQNLDSGKSCQEAKNDDFAVSASTNSENNFCDRGALCLEMCYDEFR
ncbi:MAG TPA: hypothetical protein VGF06_08140 [Terriglobales bacterium]